MNQHLRAIYENGVFRPTEPIDLKEHQEVILTWETTEPGDDQAGASLPIWEFALQLARDVPR